MARWIGDDERRARLAARHGLAGPRPSAAGPGGPAGTVAVAGRLCGLHATDAASVHLALWARLDDYAPDILGRALYDEHTAIRMLAMRRTMFVLPTDLAPTVHQACSVKVAATNRRRLVALVEKSGVAADGTAWLADAEREVLAALAERGEAQAGELSAAVPRLATKVAVAEGKSYGRDVALTNQVLTHLAAEGRIVRGRPVGGWTSTRYRWTRLAAVTDADLDAVPPADAERDLCRRWLATFGPATEDDLRWWAGWTATRTRRALHAVGAETVETSAGTAYVLPDDVEPAEAPDRLEPRAALLPALDPTAMGWLRRDFYLGGLGKRGGELFDRSGNIGPTVWWDGRVVGGWAQRADGEVVHHLLVDAGREAAAAVAATGGALRSWLGDTRFTPRFRTPLERRLTA